ncbi:MAG TPA: hypothetical protein VHS58_20920 [Acetobacteraceae bacterium]|jgi:hypothetical protein|nr:hypothetical protein [Acetobacteraceae bacterium]
MAHDCAEDEIVRHRATLEPTMIAILLITALGIIVASLAGAALDTVSRDPSHRLIPND